MGICAVGAQHSEGALINKKITQALNESRMQAQSCIKILMLGAGECGKSTVLKQMKIIHEGYQRDELAAMTSLVRENTITISHSLCDILCAAPESSNPSLTAGLNVEALESLWHAVYQLNPQGPFPDDQLPHIRQTISQLWQLELLKDACKRGQYGLMDSGPYFLDNIDRTFANNYLPLEQDVLRARKATQGVHQYNFKLDTGSFSMFDVGGQRGQRKKWISCFSGVTSLLFVASLSEYDQMLFEDKDQNRMRESITLFASIVSLPWFEDTAVILFFNKKDIFASRIEAVPLKDTFPEFEEFEAAYSDANPTPGPYLQAMLSRMSAGKGGGEGDPDSKPEQAERMKAIRKMIPEDTPYYRALTFIKLMYYERAPEDKTLYAHETNATDNENIKRVWNCVKDMILRSNLANAGLGLAFN